MFSIICGISAELIRPTVILLIRTYAFFNRSSKVLFSLIGAMAIMVGYQLYVATSQMLCKYTRIYAVHFRC